MAKLRFGSGSACPAMYPEQEGGGSATLITKSITQNGTYNASSDSADGYSSVTVNVAGGGGYSEFPTYQIVNGVATKRSGAIPANAFSSIVTINDGIFYEAYSGASLTGSLDLSSLETVGEYAMSRAFADCSGITSVNLSSLTTVGDDGMSGAFARCGITGSLDLSSLTTLSGGGMEGAMGSAFQNCSITGSLDLSSLTHIPYYGMTYTFYSNNIESVDLSSLISIEEDGMSFCFFDNKVESFDLSSLETIGDRGLYMAFELNSLTSVTFPSLIYIGAQGLYEAFSLNRKNNQMSLSSVSFPALPEDFADNVDMGGTNEDAFENMLSSNEGVTVHFPSNLQAVIGSWSDVTNGFGGTNTTVLFDLPATN